MVGKSKPGLARTAAKGALRLSVVTAMVGALMVAASASPAAAATVTPAQIVTPNSFLYQAACLDTTTCYAVGGTIAAPGVPGSAAIVRITNGVAGTAQTPFGPGYSLSDIVCYDGTTCVVYGGYRPPGSTRQDPTIPIRVLITNGVIGAPEVIPNQLSTVGCATAAYCVGETTVRVDGTLRGAFVVITNGVHGAPQLFPDNVEAIEDIACPSANTCYAVGQTPPDPNYPDPIFGDPLNLGVVVPIVGGVVGTPQLVPTAFTLYSVGCASPTTCYGVGPSNDIFNTVPLLVPIVNGIPRTPVPMSASDVITGISCMTAAICEAVGFNNQEGGGVVVPVINGVPGASQPATGTNGLQGVACSVSNCVAFGGFNPPAGGATIAVVVFITEPDLVCNGQTATSIGTPGVDKLFGTPGKDSFLAYGGNDSIYGYGGDDNVCAGAGNDVVYAGAGNDWVDGAAGNDTIVGDAGNDDLRGGDGSDRIFAGAGNDQLNGGPATDYCYKGTGTTAFTACEVFPAGM